MTNTEFVSSLRELADFYEQHSTLPIPYDFNTPMFTFLWEPGEMKQALREIGAFTKLFEDGDFSALKEIGSITLRLHCRRDQVCTPRVVGKKRIERQVIPEQIIEAHEEEIVEWDCEPVLK